MNVPHPEGADRISGVAKSPLTASAAASGIAILLIVGLLLRLTIAYVFLPGSGFESDIGTFTAWAYQLAQTGPGTFYATAGFADYPPGYLYVLWFIGELGFVLAPLTDGNATAAIQALVKIPPMLADIGIGLVLYLLVKRWRGARADAPRLALIAAAIYVFNPVSIYDSAIWGQTDSVGALVLLVMVAALIRGNAEGATALAVIAALIKPQFGVVALPVVGVVLLRRHLLRAGAMPHHPVLLPQRLRGWFEEERGVWRLVSSAVVGLGLMVLLLLPFSLDIPGYVRQMAGTAAGYPYLTVNAYNPWALIGSDGNPPFALSGLWSPDTVPLIGPIPGVFIGGIVLAVGFGLGALRLAWLDDRRSILIVTVLLALAFFMLPTRVHERYMFPIFAILPLLAVANKRWQIATLALSIAAFINMHGVLTTPLYATPNLESLPLGMLFRQPLGVLTSIALHIAGFAFIVWMARPTATPEADAFETVAEDGPTIADAGITAAPVPLIASAAAPESAPETAFPGGAAVHPTAPARPWWAPLSALVPSNSVRRDRSALLVGETGGRLNRRDLLIVLVVFVSAFFLRAFRLEVPYSMHFDEVYHARTAIEFLQNWRYGMPHSIYEFTHPHLAKYGMALGIEAMGNNRVIGEEQLGSSVTDAATETRWNTSGQPNVRNGDRLYVATGSEMRAYDLANLRGEPHTIPGPYVAVAVDETSHTLYVGQADGTVVQLPTDQFDLLRATPTDADQPIALPLVSLTGLEGDLEQLEVIGDHLVGRSSGGTLVSVDRSSALEVGRTQLDDAAAMTRAPAHGVVVADPALVTDPGEVAITLANMLGLDAADLESRITEADSPVALIGYVGDTQDDIQAQIDDLGLAGLSITEGDAVAVGTSTGVTLLDAATLGELFAMDTDAPVTGIELVTDGPDKPTLYAATGDRLTAIRVPTDGAPSLAASIQMPNEVEDVFWNKATTFVHVLGTTQDGSAPTVYVVEPRSNAVFADARLDSGPQAVVIDAQPDRPAEDRNDLLAIGDDGRLEIVDTGNNQYAYRLPGVILGALTAALIFLLGRFLFRRRQGVAIIAALLVLADGMFFANSRIAMNDVYVTFFIVAAMTLFVPLWLGRWRSGLAIAGGMIGVGVLLGLALSSKWVGAYAIGAVGLLILVRSALGRMVALGAMIALTGVLGYIAITPSPNVENPHLNYLFLLIMIALTVLLAVAITLRPVRLTRDELRLTIVGPLLLGLAAVAFGAYRLMTASPDDVSSTPMRALLAGGILIAFGGVVFVVAKLAGARGRGPWADPTEIDPDREPAAPPPPRGWLRPGSGFLGLPWLGALVAITAIPLFVYVLSYVPWLELGNRLTETFPPGNTGQLFIDLQRSMYDYHNNLRATHAASSPWWAWPLDLKPVWFEQNDYANSTTAVIYDTGNLVIFWLAIPAVAFLCWQAWKRRSLSLTFLAITIACLWLPWSRIDRATFQYHIFTTLPFSFLALAYFLAELWHGPSERTWKLARAGAALAIIGAPLLWLLRLPLCQIANTESVNPGTEVCASLSRELVLTDFQMIGVLLAIGGLAVAGVLAYLAMRPDPTGMGPSPIRALLFPVAFSVALLGVVVVLIGAGLQGNPVFQMRVSAEEPALIALLLLCVPAYFVLRGTDPRRYVIGVLAASAAFFLAFYPNVASLPVPTPLSQVHLGLLPTWNWGFQFAVNMDEPNRSPIDPFAVALLTIAVAGLCAAAVYAARSWLSLRAERETVSSLPETS